MYNYKVERSQLFTEEGQVKFISIRDRVYKLLNDSGACMMGHAINGISGDTWFLMACVDRLVELNEIKEVTKQGVAGQHRVFVKVYK